MKKAIWKLLSAIKISRRKTVPGKWVYPERRKRK